MCCPDRVLPGSVLYASLRRQPIWLLLSEELVYGRLSLSGGFDQSQELEPVEVPGEGTVGAPSDWLLANLDTLSVDEVKVLPKRRKHVRAGGFPMRRKILSREETRSVL